MTAPEKKINLPFAKNAGFTLIELLVVTAIIGILTTIAIASFNSFNRSQSIKLAAVGLQSELRAQKSYSIAGKKDAECRDTYRRDGTVGTDGFDDYSLTGYYITFNVEYDPNPGTLVLGQHCLLVNEAAGASGAPSEILEATITKQIPEGARVTSILPFSGITPCTAVNTDGEEVTVEFYSVNADPNFDPVKPFNKDLVGFFDGDMTVIPAPGPWEPACGPVDKFVITLVSNQTNIEYEVTIKSNGDISQERS